MQNPLPRGERPLRLFAAVFVACTVSLVALSTFTPPAPASAHEAAGTQESESKSLSSETSPHAFDPHALTSHIFECSFTSKDPKARSCALQEIHEAKLRGETYMGMTWHAAEAEYLARRDETSAALREQTKDGGSSDVNATFVDANPYVDPGTTLGKGNNIAIGSCLSGGSDTAEDAWYIMTFPVPVSLDVWTTCAAGGSPSFDTRIAILDASLALLDCNDDDPACSQPFYQSRIDGLILPAGTYYAVVDGYNGNAGSYEFNATWIEDPPVCAGSDRNNATFINTLPFAEIASTVDACDNILIDCELATNSSGPDKWYRLELEDAVLLDVRTACQASDLDTRIAVLDEALDPLYCNDDDPLCATYQSEVEDAYLDPGLYYIVVDSPEGAGGQFTVQVDTTHVATGTVRDLLPDIYVVQNDLYDNVIDTTVVPGRTHLRLSNATANVGDGKLYLYGVNPGEPTPTHEVRQRIWRTDGSWYDRPAGQFVYHPGHNHIHIEGWAQYNLREILPDDGVGALLASGTKTSFCIIDLRVHDTSLPGYVPGGEFHSCGTTIQGLSVGWADIYSKSLADQWIDVTDVPDGEYWLESLADPGGVISEADEKNNVARVKVTLGTPTLISPDPFEPNVSIQDVESRSPGTNNSPNLGPCAPSKTVIGLSIHVADNDDYFRFYMPADGGGGDFVRIDFLHSVGDLDIQLYDDGGNVRASSTSTSDEEVISMSGRPRGWYYLRVYGYNGVTHPDYSLTIDPSENASPSITVVDPPAGDVELLHSIDSYPVTWNSSDPEGDQLWCSIWVNTTPTLDGNEIFLETSQNTPAELELYVLASTYLPLGTFYVYATITDGGTVVGDWSEGTFTLIPQTPVAAPSDRVIVQTRLLPSTPNPFNPSTLLKLELNRTVTVSWDIYDLRGVRVRQIPAGHLHAGVHTRSWNGKDDRGQAVSSGVYFAVVRGAKINLSQKLVLLK